MIMSALPLVEEEAVVRHARRGKTSSSLLTAVGAPIAARVRK